MKNFNLEIGKLYKLKKNDHFTCNSRNVNVNLNEGDILLVLLIKVISGKRDHYDRLFVKFFDFKHNEEVYFKITNISHRYSDLKKNLLFEELKDAKKTK